MSATARRLITTDDLFRIRWLADPQISPDGRRVAFTVTSLDRERDAIASQVFWCAVDGGELHVVGSRAANNTHPRWSPDGERVAIISDASDGNQIWIAPADDGAMRQLTHASHGVTEFGWSPDGQRIVFVASDDKHKHLWTIAVDGGPASQLTHGECDDSAPQWSPDGRYIAFLSNRASPLMDIWLTTPTGDETRCLTHSVGPIHTLAWSPANDAIAYIGHDQASAQGVNFNVWLATLDGCAPRNLTTAFDRSIGQVVRADDLRGMEPPPLGWSSNGRIYFAFADGGQSHIGWVESSDSANDSTLSLSQGAAERTHPATGSGCLRLAIDGKRACLAFTLARDADRIAFVASDALNPGDIFVADYEGNDERRVTAVNDAWLSELSLSAPSRIAFTADDGQTIEGWLMRPPSTASGRRYPLILQIHGGPHYPLGERFYFDFQRLAAQGYAILYVNMRGSQGYGESFATQIRGAWGARDYRDLMQAVDLVVGQGEVDESRIAVTGVSYGGYMTNWMIGHTSRFRAAICENGISNLVTNFATSTAGRGESFWTWEMDGTPTTQPERYRALSPIAYADNIHTPLLLIHAEQDTNCSIAQSEELHAALRSFGRDVSLVRIPGEGHLMNLVGAPSHRLMRMAAMDEWWARWL